MQIAEETGSGKILETAVSFGEEGGQKGWALWQGTKKKTAQ